MVMRKARSEKKIKIFYGISTRPASHHQTEKIMKSLLILILVELLNVSATTTRQITGIVTDEKGNGIPGVLVENLKINSSAVTDTHGLYLIEVGPNSVLKFSKKGYKPVKLKVSSDSRLDVTLKKVEEPKEEIEIFFEQEFSDEAQTSSMMIKRSSTQVLGRAKFAPISPMGNTESYSAISENGFKETIEEPLSTFSIDVDAASYSNVRRFINGGQLPPKDAVRIEEMINYFDYNYKTPDSKHPFAINTAVSSAPWNEDHLLVQIGLQGEKIEMESLPPSNIVFLIDVSGSMNYHNKLPLLKSSLKMLTTELREEDRVSIVVYAGAAGLVLPPTPGNEKKKIMDTLEELSAGGSTAGGAGIKLAYKTALQNYVDGGNNRVIIATDGDFNVGASSDAEMQRLIEDKREEGVFLTVLGYGMGNYKDSKMETLADRGNGNYAYIDNIQEAKKVLVSEFGGTLFTIAKDVKIQVEFNPTLVKGYRLIGYENRLLENEDFNDDTKDAGELGAGHTVTALYEIIPAGVASELIREVDPLKYQQSSQIISENSTDLLTVKFRYKAPNDSKSKLLSSVVTKDLNNLTEDLGWASAVAGFGMMLRDSEFKNDLDYNQILALAKAHKGDDPHGYRTEFINLVQATMKIQGFAYVEN